MILILLLLSWLEVQLHMQTFRPLRSAARGKQAARHRVQYIFTVDIFYTVKIIWHHPCSSQTTAKNQICVLSTFSLWQATVFLLFSHTLSLVLNFPWPAHWICQVLLSWKADHRFRPHPPLHQIPLVITWKNKSNSRSGSRRTDSKKPGQKQV